MSDRKSGGGGSPPPPAATPTPTGSPPAVVKDNPVHTCSAVPNMTHEEKMVEAIKRAKLAPAIMEALGDIKSLVAQMAVIGGALALIAATGYGAVAEAIGAGLLAVGAAMSGAQIGSGLVQLYEFFQQTRCDTARSLEDLDKAAKSFADAMADLGVGGLNLTLSLLGGRGKSLSGRPLSEIPRGVGINGATRTVPLGFESEEQFLQAARELQDALKASGVDDAVVGARGSSVTGRSITKNTEFGPQSDIDMFIESATLTEGYRPSKNIPGFVHPNKIMPDYPALDAWSQKWSSVLGREITPGAFQVGTIPAQPAIVVK